MKRLEELIRLHCHTPDDEGRIVPKGIEVRADRVYWRSQEHGLVRIHTAHEIGTPEFMADWANAVNSARPRMTVAIAVSDYQASTHFEGLADATQREYIRYQAVFVKRYGGRSIKWLESTDGVKGVLALREEYHDRPRAADYIVAGVLALMRHLLNIAEVKTNPYLALRSQHRANRRNILWTDEDVEAIIRNTRLPLPIRAGVIVGRATGLRLGDVLRARWDDYHPSANGVPAYLEIWTQKSQGRTLQRSIIDPDYVGALQSLRSDYETLVYRTGKLKGRPYTRDGWSSVYQRSARQLIPAELHYHDLRSTYATAWLKRGGLTDDALAEMMGWTVSSVEALKKRYVPACLASSKALQQVAAMAGTPTQLQLSAVS